ncbi:hypothetical protein FISHEDRAFT_63786 [Fistulina hepatica ATCC 64428]|uniref:Wax synthase domain-containing protein n=1 Tax=Fistulina hepatica ATCC 64428 TaxID=1128425 RepID=A0A0D7AM72_9AGAR|nr:hypothetical protein FISHEDRAFT_63786 [Fistulina hepatica ATCC 64428]
MTRFHADTLDEHSSSLRILLVFLTCVAYFLSAILSIRPGAKYLQWTLLPLALFCAYSFCTRHLFKFEDETFIYFNQLITLIAVSMSFRMIAWALTGPYERVERFYSGTYPSWVQILFDAFDLMGSLRGQGWDWGMRFPNNESSSRPFFAFKKALSAAFYITAADSVHFYMQTAYPTLTSPHGTSVYDDLLNPLERYVRVYAITLPAGLATFCSLEGGYDLLAVIGVLCFGQQPAQWPPLFNHPYIATSLSELWGYRWHQLFRHTFVEVGSRPMQFFFGDVGAVFGAFLVSALIHDWGLWGMGKGSDFWRCGGFFLMMAVGQVAEISWKRVTGRKVRGVLGWLWVATWAGGWAPLIVEAWFTRGVCGSKFFGSEENRPARLLLSLLVR